MTRRQKYFMKQKLFGVVCVILGILTLFIPEYMDGFFTIMLIGGGILLIFTKDMFIVDDYKLEVEERRELRERQRSYR
jgi:hypothetical protein